MDVQKMLADLREERGWIEEAILILERLARGRRNRRGRPPAWMVEAQERAGAKQVRKSNRGKRSSAPGGGNASSSNSAAEAA